MVGREAKFILRSEASIWLTQIRVFGPGIESFSTYVLVFGIHTYMVHSRHMYNIWRIVWWLIFILIHIFIRQNMQMDNYSRIWWLMIFVNLILFVKTSHKRDWLSIYNIYIYIYALYFGSGLDVLKNWLIFPLWIYSFGIIND